MSSRKQFSDPAADAIKIDSTFLTIEQVVEKMLKIIEKA